MRAIHENIRSEITTPRIANSLTKGGGKPGQGFPCVAFHEDQRTGAVYENGHTHALSASGGGKPGQGYQAIRLGLTVRRMTAVECLRLQGATDDWLNVEPPLSDGAKQRCYGNGVTVPVAKWIANRIREVEESSP